MTVNLALIALTVVVGALGFAGLMFKSWQDKKTGGALEAGKVNAVSVAAEVKIAQAVVDAPRTQAAITDRFKAGSF